MQRKKLSCRGQGTCPSSLTYITKSLLPLPSPRKTGSVPGGEAQGTSCGLPGAGPCVRGSMALARERVQEGGGGPSCQDKGSRGAARSTRQESGLCFSNCVPCF